MENRMKMRAWIPEAKHLRAECKDGMFYQEDQYLYSFIRRIHDQFVVNHPTQLPFELEERLMLSSGVKDCEGKEIYRGDLIEYNIFEYDKDDNMTGMSKKKARREVMFNGGIYGTGDRILSHIEPYRKLKVIGNIYLNPELMKK